MEKLLINEGFCHIYEAIFKALSVKSLIACLSVNSSFKRILENPKIWIAYLEYVDENSLKKEFIELWTSIKQQKLDIRGSLKTRQKTVLEIGKIEVSITNCIVKFLQETNTPKNLTAVHVAARYGKLNLILYLSKNRKIEETKCCFSSRGDLPVHEAALRGNLEFIKVLTKADLEILVSKDSSGRSPIHLAAIKGHFEVVKYLVTILEDSNPLSVHGETPIFFAAKYGHLNIVKYLYTRCEKPMNPQVNGFNPLHIATIAGQVEVVKYFLRHCSIEMQANQISMKTVFHYAAEHGQLEILKMLVPKALHPLAACNNGFTAIHYATLNGHIEVVKYLAKFAKNPNCSRIGSPSTTPLGIAMKNDNVKLVKTLLEIITKKIGHCSENERKDIYASLNEFYN